MQLNMASMTLARYIASGTARDTAALFNVQMTKAKVNEFISPISTVNTKALVIEYNELQFFQVVQQTVRNLSTSEASFQ